MRATTQALAIVWILSLVGPVLAEEAGALDGRTFAVTLVAQGGGEGQSDTLIFEAGRFDSVECRQYGFGKTPYDTEKEGETWLFSVEAHSAEEGVTRWRGTVSGDAVAGTMEWVKAGQDTIRYEFRGVLKR